MSDLSFFASVFADYLSDISDDELDRFAVMVADHGDLPQLSTYISNEYARRERAS